MSIPSATSKGIASEKSGGTSPSPVEGVVESVAGPSSTLDTPIPLPEQSNEELDDFGETADEEEEESTEEDCEVNF